MCKALCPVCDGIDLEPILEWRGIPVLQNHVYTTAQDAHRAVRGNITLMACRTCTFTFNRSFESALVNYGPGYDNCQTASQTFCDHLATVRQSIAGLSEQRTGTVLEVGCGNGVFLSQLVSQELPAWNGIGLDPSYTGDSPLLGGRLRFTADYFNERHQSIRADIVFSRHVIEHVPDPVLFVRRMVNCATGNPHSRILLETPCFKWTLKNHAFWDISYEHCSLFTSDSLNALLNRADAQALNVETVFGSQYLLAKARPALTNTGRIALVSSDYNSLVAEFAVKQAGLIVWFLRKIEKEKKCDVLQPHRPGR